ncbi:MAG TPA: universal stress protein [Chloroflexota bacterium]|nr:universal stress protein [Chloroflexota bacterium]
MVDLDHRPVRVPPPDGRPSADEMLDRVRQQAGGGARGRHRVYLGIAPGVGKTYTALEELHRRKERGTDVVIGFIETHGRPKTAELAAGLEAVPRRQIAYKGVTVEEMDTDAVVRRHPALAFVDELAHTNAPGSKHEKRWQDVEDLLEAGITVISTVNIQHLESLADLVANVTGVQVRERVPDRVLDGCDEVELIDMSPHALRQRMKHGNIYPPERAERALTQFFREGNLIALREMALRKVAQVCEQDLEHYMKHEGIDAAWSAGERVMVCVDDQPTAQNLMRRGWRLANRYQTDLLAVFVETARWASAAPDARRAVEDNLRFAEDLGAELVRIRSNDVARALMQVAHEKNVGAIVIGHSRHGRLHELLRRSIVQNLLRLAADVDVHVVADRDKGEH